MKDFIASIEIQVFESGLYVTLKTDKWEGWELCDDGYIVAEEASTDDLRYLADMAIERMMSDKSPFEEES